MDITIIGLGGIGSHLSPMIARYASYSMKTESPININLVDGDYYETKNMERQDFDDLGNKAEIKARELQQVFPRISFNAIPYFLDETTIPKIVKNGDIVFLAVDNHKSRKILSDYAREKLSDVTIISGGNELVDGNVQIYVRKGGEDITPALTDYHPEIDNPIDKLPNEMSCEELMNSGPQILFTNAGAALLMSWAFYNALSDNYKYSEIYFDVQNMKVDSKVRTPKKSK